MIAPVNQALPATPSLSVPVGAANNVAPFSRVPPAVSPLRAPLAAPPVTNNVVPFNRPLAPVNVTPAAVQLPPLRAPVATPAAAKMGYGGAISGGGAAIGAYAGAKSFFDWAYPQPYLPPGSTGTLPPGASTSPEPYTGMAPNGLPYAPRPSWMPDWAWPYEEPPLPNELPAGAMEGGPLAAPGMPAVPGEPGSVAGAPYEVRWSTEVYPSYAREPENVYFGLIGPITTTTGTDYFENGQPFINWKEFIGANGFTVRLTVTRWFSNGVVQYRSGVGGPYRSDGGTDPPAQPEIPPEFAPNPNRNPSRPGRPPRVFPPYTAPNLPESPFQPTPQPETEPTPQPDLPWPATRPAAPPPGRDPFAPDSPFAPPQIPPEFEPVPPIDPLTPDPPGETEVPPDLENPPTTAPKIPFIIPVPPPPLTPINPPSLVPPIVIPTITVPKPPTIQPINPPNIQIPQIPTVLPPGTQQPVITPSGPSIGTAPTENPNITVTPPTGAKQPNLPTGCCPDLWGEKNWKELRDLRRRVGVDDFPANVPDQIAKENPFQKDLNSLAELHLWQVEQLDGVLGRWPQQIQFPTPAGPVNVGMPNVSEAMAEIVGMLLSQQVTASQILHTSSRTLAQAGSATQQAHLAHLMSKANAEFLGYEGRSSEVDMPLAYSPGSDPGEGLLQESRAKIKGWQNTDGQDMKQIFAELLHAASIIRAVYWRQLNPRNDMNQQIKDKVQGQSAFTDETLPTPTSENDWEQYLKDIEDGFRTITGDGSPYGRNPSEGPKIRDLSPDNEA